MVQISSDTKCFHLTNYYSGGNGDYWDIKLSNSYLLLDSLVTVVLAPPTALLKFLMLSEEYKPAGLLYWLVTTMGPGELNGRALLLWAEPMCFTSYRSERESTIKMNYWNHPTTKIKRALKGFSYSYIKMNMKIQINLKSAFCLWFIRGKKYTYIQMKIQMVVYPAISQ